MDGLSKQPRLTVGAGLYVGVGVGMAVVVTVGVAVGMALKQNCAPLAHVGAGAGVDVGEILAVALG